MVELVTLDQCDMFMYSDTFFSLSRSIYTVIFYLICRCVCPGGSWGPRCKVLARTFTASGWAWVRHLPSCLPTTISFRILTRCPDALVLYSGPLTPVPRRPGSLPSPMIAVQVMGGRPQVLLEGVGESVKVEVKAIVNDGYWHTVHVLVDTQVRRPV